MPLAVTSFGPGPETLTSSGISSLPSARAVSSKVPVWLTDLAGMVMVNWLFALLVEKSPVGGVPVTSVAPFISPGATVTVTSVFPLRVEEVTPAKPVVTVTVWVVPSTTTSGETDSSMPVSASFMYISL